MMTEYLHQEGDRQGGEGRGITVFCTSQNALLLPAQFSPVTNSFFNSDGVFPPDTNSSFNSDSVFPPETNSSVNSDGVAPP